MRHRHATGAPDRLTKVGMGQAKARQHPAPAWASQLGAKPGHPELGVSSVPLLQRGCSGEGGDRQSPQHSSKHRPLGTGPGAVLLPGAWSLCPGLCRVWPLALQSSTGGSPGHRSAVLQGPGAVPHAEQGWGPWGLWRGGGHDAAPGQDSRHCTRPTVPPSHSGQRAQARGSWQCGQPNASSWYRSTCTVHDTKPNLFCSWLVASRSTVSGLALVSGGGRDPRSAPQPPALGAV